MKVKELIRLLLGASQEAEVIIIDQEANTYPIKTDYSQNSSELIMFNIIVPKPKEGNLPYKPLKGFFTMLSRVRKEV